MKKATPSYMVYGELGITPLSVDINTRIVSFWAKLINDFDKNKLSSTVYNIMFNLHKDNEIKSQWIDNVKCLLCSLGFSGIWDTQSFLNTKWIVAATKQKSLDLYIQKWFSTIENTSNSNTYKLFKTKFERSHYINLLPRTLCLKYIRFRTRNHRLPVETGRWRSVPLSDRTCNHCNKDLGDEYHYLLTCEYFKNERIKFIKPIYYRRPNVLKFQQLMNTTSIKELRNVCHFIDILDKHVR